MISLDLPTLPAPFTDCAALFGPIDDGPTVPAVSLLETPDIVRAGVHAIAGKWGPGDLRAAASLWSYGYFSRLLRPLLAYGVLADRWFSTGYDDVAAALSPMSTVARFGVRDSCEPEQAIDSVIAHVEFVIARCSAHTETTDRLHRSNAEFVFWRTLHLLSMSEEAAHHDRLTRINCHTAEFFPAFGKLVSRSAGTGPTRRVCCLRDRLSSLNRCANACPLQRRQA
ncbi:hypothetical protein [Mycoplana rhizolycopersici]|uniref:Uncharacterized protein n=1 Tax=Mycoplana rhizolycopersici TaxID=2746702 RepID=A0ABX2QI42_9HYPH|nr:hypothetical protein [Rhizobium rhizolycopersici]NVP57011.1 hypothetical protein [Rhizobium rhizolycopersici]